VSKHDEMINLFQDVVRRREYIGKIVIYKEN